jgi:alkaline phosphatase
MYAQNVYRDDYQDLARAMLGVPGIIQQTRQGALYSGLDVVIGTGYGVTTNAKSLAAQGRNGVAGNLFITDADLAAININCGGKYVVVHTVSGQNGGQALIAAAHNAAQRSARLFGFFGRNELDHLPFQTADGRYDPVPSLDRDGQPQAAESYSVGDLTEQPTFAEMTQAALAVLADPPGRPFALFIEAGDVDFALHANNLDNAVGAIYSGEEAVRTVIRWVETHSNWNEALLLVSSDHGHYLVVDDPRALAAAR